MNDYEWYSTKNRYCDCIDIVTNSGISEDNGQQMQNHFDVKFK